jgi:hypothetical protein
MEVDYKNLRTQLKCLNNCSQSDEDGVVVNLNPEFAVPEDLIHQDHIFPWLLHAPQVFDLGKIGSKRKGQGGSFDVYNALGGSHFLPEEWQALKKAWSLHTNGRKELSFTVRKDFFESRGAEKTPDLLSWQFGFAMKLITPGYVTIFEDAASFLNKTRSDYQSEFSKFKQFHTDQLIKPHNERYFEVCSEYFKYFSEYSQVIVYVKNNTKLPSDCQASSSAFPHTKMFYGDAYEALTSNIVVLACLNNIACGRKYDAFAKMDLKKCMTINKANRANPFQDTAELNRFSECLDSTLRNSSHHGAIKYDRNRRTVNYRSGGTGAEQTMSYSEYLVKCNKIMLTLACLFMLEFII